MYAEDFDGMAEGLSPPTGWIGQTVTNFEVDDVQSNSAPHSAWLRHTGAAKCRLEESFTSERLRLWFYLDDLVNERAILTLKATGLFAMSNVLVYLSFQAGANIKYYKDGFVDTGYNYTVGFHKVEMVHDLGANTVDVWYDGIKIMAGAAFQNVGTSVEAVHIATAANIDTWWDDMQIGEAAATAPVLLLTRGV